MAVVAVVTAVRAGGVITLIGNVTACAETLVVEASEVEAPVSDEAVVAEVLAVLLDPVATEEVVADDSVSVLPPPQAVIAALVTRIAKLVDMRGKKLIFDMDCKLKAASAGINTAQNLLRGDIWYSAALPSDRAAVCNQMSKFRALDKGH